MEEHLELFDPHRRSRSSAPHITTSLTSIARSGRIAAFRRRGAVELVHIYEDRRRTIDTPGRCDFGFGAGGLWVLGAGILHWMTETGDSLLDTIVGDRVTVLTPSRSALPSCILGGRGTDIVELYDGSLFAFPLVLGTREGERVFPIGPRLVVVATPERVRAVHLEHGTAFSYELPPHTVVRAVSALFSGTALAFVLDGPRPEIWMVSATGQSLLRTEVPRPDLVAFAEDRGIGIVGAGRSLCAIDLTRNGEREWAEPPVRVDDLDICARGRDLVIAQRAPGKPRTWHVPYSAIFR